MPWERPRVVTQQAGPCVNVGVSGGESWGRVVTCTWMDILNDTDFQTSFRRLYAELCQGIVDIAISSVFLPPEEEPPPPPAAFIKL